MDPQRHPLRVGPPLSQPHRAAVEGGHPRRTPAVLESDDIRLDLRFDLYEDPEPALRHDGPFRRRWTAGHDPVSHLFLIRRGKYIDDVSSRVLGRIIQGSKLS